MKFVDPDWNSQETWNQITDLAKDCQKHKMKILGIVDRMILLSAIKSKSLIWTTDKKLIDLAQLKKCAFEG